jgi:hypothetical protein
MRFENAVDLGKRLRYQLIAMCVSVFVSFLIRASYSIMFALGNVLANSDIDCDDYSGRCSACYNEWTHMRIWMFYNPSFHFTVVVTSQPFTLLVSLWGMTAGAVPSHDQQRQ